MNPALRAFVEALDQVRSLVGSDCAAGSSWRHSRKAPATNLGHKEQKCPVCRTCARHLPCAPMIERISRDRLMMLLAAAEGKRVAVIGDAMLDVYLRGDVDRIS